MQGLCSDCRRYQEHLVSHLRVYDDPLKDFEVRTKASALLDVFNLEYHGQYVAGEPLKRCYICRRVLDHMLMCLPQAREQERPEY